MFAVNKVEAVEKLFCMLSSDTVDVALRRSAAEQLSVVLQGERSRKNSFFSAILINSLRLTF